MRPSHTVRSGLPTMMNEGDMVAHRMLAGKPVIVCGDGTNPVDAHAIRGPRGPLHQNLLGNSKAFGEVFHITGDKGFTRNDIYHVETMMSVRRALFSLFSFDHAKQFP